MGTNWSSVSCAERKTLVFNGKEVKKSNKRTSKVRKMKGVYLLAKIDLFQFLQNVGHILQLERGAVFWVMDKSGKILFHPDPSRTGMEVNSGKGISGSKLLFLRHALEDEKSAGTYFQNSTADGNASFTGAATSAAWIGKSGIVLVLEKSLSTLDSTFKMIMRGIVVTILGFVILYLLIGQLWMRLKRVDLVDMAHSTAAVDLEKMVEARTVELNFVTRTIKDLIDSIPSALVVLDRQLNILLVNLSFYSIFSSRRTNITGKNISSLFSGEFHNRLQKTLRTKDPIYDMQVRKNIEGHGEKVLLVNVLHLLGKRDRFLMVIEDISERKVLERQLIQAEKMSGLGTLMSGIAHEINNPLNAIAGMAQIILSRVKDEEVQDDAQHILQYVNRVAEIVKELSRYSRSAKVTDAITADIHSVIGGALGMVKHSRKLQDVDVEKSYAHDLPSLKLNVVEMEQVFINLISNGIDSLDEKASKVEGDYKKKMRIVTSLHGGGFTQIELEDNGMGIPSEHLKKIFDPFFSTKEQGKGTGLGLSICYKIIQRYGGIILVESQVDIGTKFIIRLPIQSAKS